MTLLIVGLLLFLGIHSVAIVAPAWRDAQLAQRGEPAWKGLYSVAAAIGLGLIIYGSSLARQAPLVLYTPPTARRHVALLMLLPVFVLLLAAYLPGRIKTAVKHPMLLATKLWPLRTCWRTATWPTCCCSVAFSPGPWPTAFRSSAGRCGPCWVRRPGQRTM